MEHFDKFEQELHVHIYHRLAKFAALLGFFIGMGVVFMAYSE